MCARAAAPRGSVRAGVGRRGWGRGREARTGAGREPEGAGRGSGRLGPVGGARTWAARSSFGPRGVLRGSGRVGRRARRGAPVAGEGTPAGVGVWGGGRAPHPPTPGGLGPRGGGVVGSCRGRGAGVGGGGRAGTYTGRRARRRRWGPSSSSGSATTPRCTAGGFRASTRGTGRRPEKTKRCPTPCLTTSSRCKSRHSRPWAPGKSRSRSGALRTPRPSAWWIATGCCRTAGGATHRDAPTWGRRGAPGSTREGPTGDRDVDLGSRTPRHPPRPPCPSWSRGARTGRAPRAKTSDFGFGRLARVLSGNFTTSEPGGGPTHGPLEDGGREHKDHRP